MQQKKTRSLKKQLAELRGETAEVEEPVKEEKVEEPVVEEVPEEIEAEEPKKEEPKALTSVASPTKKETPKRKINTSRIKRND